MGPGRLSHRPLDLKELVGGTESGTRQKDMEGERGEVSEREN